MEAQKLMNYDTQTAGVQNKPEVTKAWLAEKIKQDPSRTIGRALAAIYKNQTEVEQSATCTNRNNGIGFSKSDVRVGSIGARMYNAKGFLQPWIIEKWTTPAKDGFPRICKYADQLQKIAEAKVATLRVSHPTSNLVIL